MTFTIFSNFKYLSKYSNLRDGYPLSLFFELTLFREQQVCQLVTDGMSSMTGVTDPRSAADTLPSSEGGATMDLHGVVLTQAFDSLLSADSRVLVVTSDRRQLSVSHPILLLFSPLLRR